MSFLTTSSEKDALKAELAEIINDKIAAGIADCEALARKWKRDLDDGTTLEPVAAAMQRNARIVSQAFDLKLDTLTGAFWKQTANSRRLTHQMAQDDIRRQQQIVREKEALKKKQDGQHYISWSKTQDAWDQEWDDW